MATCTHCGAALPPASVTCAFCGSRNDVDLRAIHPFTVTTPVSPRHCPRCRGPLQTLDLKIDGRFLIERCPGCLGLFFDPNELDALLDASLAHVAEIDFTRLQNLTEVKRKDEYPLGYIPCPVCGGLMNRINYGTRSGVIVDRCRDHGVWLDGGELRRILEWAKAGGQIHHERSQLEAERLELRAERQKLEEERARLRADALGGGLDLSAGMPGFPGASPLPAWQEGGILRLVARLLGLPL
ncbi:MAG TPA: zf-TFIIB domain-containing protein [Candidatus Aminicenantes bacterium]|nr:zf-TFIIB domain-containing protein [Candidatus Aminicenantes bacterium]